MKRIKATYKGNVFINFDIPYNEKQMLPIDQIKKNIEETITVELQSMISDGILDGAAVEVTKESTTFEVAEE